MRLPRIALWVTLVAGVALASPPCRQLYAQENDPPMYGARIGDDGWVRFRVYAPDARSVNLLLYDRPDAVESRLSIPMTREGTDWRIRLRGRDAGHGLFYMYQADGPRGLSPDDRFEPHFNPNFPLNDPYAFDTGNVSGSAMFADTPFADTDTPVYAGGGKSRVYDHRRGLDPGHVAVPPQDLIVYELHVQDYTARLASLRPELRGTYLGLAEGGLTTPGGLSAGIDHLAELGVTAVELMPVMEYDEETGNAPDRFNHWGYMTTNFFAPESRYAAVSGHQVAELKDLVRAFHARNIAVFMDVVFNHTAEGQPYVVDDRVAARCFNVMCLALGDFYRPTADGTAFSNATGTGNDVDFTGGDRFTKKLTRDSLAHWYQTYGIDGFRFDLARILAEGSDNAADWVDNDPRFAAAHLHAEPWDLGGVWWDFMDGGGWNADNNRWAKWLGRYRDQIRRFSASGLSDRRAFKQLIEGRGAVADGFGPPASSRPWRSVNILAVHDGYTLRDCVFFNDTDGSHNCWDSGGDENLRREREKLLMGVLLTSQGVPVILQGDEFGRTQSGAASQADAHNTYNYESMAGDPAIDRVNWVDWSLKDGNTGTSPHAPTYGRELYEWTRHLIDLRKRWSHFRRADFVPYIDGAPDDRDGPGNDGALTYAWEGPAEGMPTQLAAIWWGKNGEPDLMVVYNEHWEPFTLGTLGDWSGGDWKIAARSWFGRGDDRCDLASWQTSCPDAGTTLKVKARSMAVLVSDSR